MMAKVQHYLLKLLTFSFVISAISLFLGFAGEEASILEDVFGGLGFYGSLLTSVLFVLHVIVFLISKVVKAR